MTSYEDGSASVGDLVAQVQTALGFIEAAEQTGAEAAQRLAETHASLAQVLDGTTNQHAIQGLESVSTARTEIGDYLGFLAAAKSMAQEWVNNATGGGQ